MSKGNILTNNRVPWLSQAVRASIERPGRCVVYPCSGVHLSFDELEVLVRNERPDWKAALESAKGIYMITDFNTSKRYVGSAYGDQGIWSRWCSYIASGHGGNVELRLLATDPTLDYCRKSFRFALLEHRPHRTPDDIIFGRESFWKRILLTRGQEGLNRN